jgi:hypothetical protein
MVSMPILFALVVFVGILATFWRLLAIKELALAGAKKHCQDMGVQFLDGSVVQCGFRVRLKSGWRLVVLQTFSFEFTTTGERRYIGWTTFSGRKRVSMELQPHVFPEF